MSIDVSVLFWLFLIFILLQPSLKRKMLESSRMRLIHSIEKKRNSRVILLVHRQETMSILGLPIVRYIDINDSEEVIRAIHLTDSDVPIDLVLHTPGGLVLAALQIACAIRRHPAKVTVFIPHYAMSGGTLIALAADEIVMDEHAVMGPVDPQVNNYPAVSIMNVLEQKDKNRIDDNTLIIADISRKAIRQVKQKVFELLEIKMDEQKAKELSDILVKGHWTHDHPICFEDVKRLGLPVTKEMDKQIYKLMNLFPQPLRTQATVHYIPQPHRTPKRTEDHLKDI